MNQLVEKILGEIRNQGVISFARFMECALYCPVYGYYEKEGDTVGRRGDYYTSVSVGSLFGELLAFQFAEWLSALQSALPGSPLRIVEAGAHQGELAKDVLTWLAAHQPALCQGIEYCIVEPSERRQEWQRRTLASFQSQVRWFNSLPELSGTFKPGTAPPLPTVRGVIFGNELLDALPVHRWGWDATRSVWFEWGVTFSTGRFSWDRLSDRSSEIVESGPELTAGPESRKYCSKIPLSFPAELLQTLPDGFVLELCPAAEQWWTEAAEILGSGKLLAIDYGLTSEELVSPQRTGGTVRAYRRHQLAPDVLQDPGEQDITAHVNFSALRSAGESAGLTTELCWTQERFLTRIASAVFNSATGSSDWTKERTRQFQTLTHPNHLGHSFRVLVQSR